MTLPRAWRPDGITALRLATVALVAYPWLHAGARGPSPGVEPWLASLTIVAVLLALASATRGRMEISRGVLGALAAAALAIWLGDFTAHGSLAASPAAVAAWLALAAIAACAAVGSTLRIEGAASTSRISLLAWAWLAAGLLSTAIALAQYFGWADIFGALAVNSPGRQAYANLRQKNLYAGLANIALLSALWLTLYGKPVLPRWAASGAALLLGAGLAASASRTGAIQLLAVLVIAAWWHKREAAKAAWLFVPLSCYVLAAVVLFYDVDAAHATPGLLRRLGADAPACLGRGVLWPNMLQLAAERPWQGWGWGELSHAFYMGEFEPRFCALVENAHSLPLHLAVELGAPVAIASCAACAFAVFRLRPWRETDPARRLAWAVIALVGLHSLVEYPLWYGPFLMTLGLCLGLLCAPGRGQRVSRTAAGGLALALAAMAAYAAADYRRVSQLYLPTQARAPEYRDDTWDKVGDSWLFQDEASFARLGRIPLHRETAAAVHALAGRVLHMSPEPRVIEKRIASARLLGLDDQASAEIERYRAAFPAAHAAWARRSAQSSD